MRPNVPPVKQLLREGRRMTAPGARTLSARLLFRSEGTAALAISAPKRHLKRAVDRNRLKRLVREAVRRGPTAALPVDLLILLNGPAPALVRRDRTSRRAAWHEIDALLARVAAAAVPAAPANNRGR